MTASEVSGGGAIGRAGSLTVAMLADELSVRIMRSMAGGFEALTLAQQEISPEASLDSDEPKYAITATGRERLPVASAIEYWLMKAPGGGLAYEDNRAEEAIEALAEAWACGLMHALAYGPQTEARLDRDLEGLGRRTIKRLLKKMRRAGLVDTHEGEGGETAYTPTEWLRRGVAPLALAARVERRKLPDGAAPIDALDVEAALLLAVPLLGPAAGLAGSCRLAVQMGSSAGGPEVGVTVTVEEGRIVACVLGLDPDAPTEAIGNIRAWFRAIIDGSANRLDFSGDRPLARALVDGLSEVLFGAG